MPTETTAFQFTIPLTAEQAQEAVELVNQYDRTLEEDDDLAWGNDDLLEYHRAGRESCLTADVTNKGLLITYDDEADIDIAQAMTESLLDRFDIDKPVVFRYGVTTSRGRESSGGAILAHRDPKQSQFANARDIEDLMNAGVNVQELLADAMRLAKAGMTVPNLYDATLLLRKIAKSKTEDEYRREFSIEKGAETEEEVEEKLDTIHLGGEFHEANTQDLDRYIKLARNRTGIVVEPAPLPDLEDDETDEPDTSGPSM